MAVVMRGWSKTASPALKLATAERIIGYQFKDVDKLYEALDQTGRRMSLPSGQTARLRRRNFRLALVGDALGNLHLARDWYDRANLSGVDWTEIQRSTLSNERLGEVGFKLGLDECAISKEIVRSYDMATTLEALIAAVDMDGASQAQVRKVCTRFGIEHKRLEPEGRLWIWELVRSKLSLPDKFFIGHHFKLQEGIFDTQLWRSPARKNQQIWLWGRARRLWRLTRQLWQPRKEAETKPNGKENINRLSSHSATQTPGKKVPLARRSRSVAITTMTIPPVDESISKIDLLVEDSVGHQQENEKAAAPEKTTDTESLAERHGVSESSTSEASTYSRPTGRQPRPLLEEGTSADDAESAETLLQDPNTTSNGEAALTPSRVAASGTEKQVGHPAHEASDADYAEPATENKSKAQLKIEAKQMTEKAGRLRKAIIKIQAQDKMTKQDHMKIRALRKQRRNTLERRSDILQASRRDG